MGPAAEFHGKMRFAVNAAPHGENPDHIAILFAEQRKRAFFSQPLYARAAVVLGGPFANLLFAFVLLTAVFFVAGEPYTPPTIAVQMDGPAAEPGARPVWHP